MDLLAGDLFSGARNFEVIDSADKSALDTLGEEFFEHGVANYTVRGKGNLLNKHGQFVVQNCRLQIGWKVAGELV